MNARILLLVGLCPCMRRERSRNMKKQSLGSLVPPLPKVGEGASSAKLGQF